MKDPKWVARLHSADRTHIANRIPTAWPGIPYSNFRDPQFTFPFVTVAPIRTGSMLKMVNFNLVKKIRFFGMYGIVIHILAGLFLLKH
ncbi:MAG: hypothetical protein ACK52S_16290, partial [Pirellula sp.]